MPQDDPNPGQLGWSAAHAAVSAEWLVDDDGQQGLALLRHPTQAFMGEIAADEANPDGALRRIASAYIQRVRDTLPPGQGALPVLGLAGEWLLADKPDGFGWLDLGWGGDRGDTDPRLSFWVQRRPAGANAAAVDRSVVLLAANRHQNRTQQCCEGLSVGLRVVMHLADTPDAQGRCVVRVSGLSASRLGLARGPLLAASTRAADRLAPYTAHQSQAAAALGLLPDSVQLSGALLPADELAAIALAGSGRGQGSGDATRVFEWTALMQPGAPANASLQPLSRVEQVSHGAGMGFMQDGASQGPASSEVQRRPTRPEAQLDLLRAPTLPLNTPAGMMNLVDPLTPPRYLVRQSVVADLSNNPSLVQQVDPHQLPLRGDHLSAFHAWCRAAEFFDRLAAYGLPAATYFKFARLPLVMRHRAWFHSQPDGQTVNAQVRPDDAPRSFFEDFDSEKRPRLEVLFGAANLAHRDLRTDQHGQLRAQPMGLAADPRWAWHEFGHVLSYAATGALEFHFAHSAGDALAAIIADPDSQLALGPDCRSADAMAGLTFPWVPMQRRHDRSVSAGWCWCGRRNGQRQARFRLPAPLFKGYVEEQLLSSSLFVLYRALGGDSFGQPARRQLASHYCVYLMMRAITLLGPAAVVPALTADAFVSALIDADVGTGLWQAPPPAGVEARVGGMAHKLIRWAFEQQGLYAADQPSDMVEGVGLPPRVDLYVAGWGDRQAGGYAPVNLDWTADPELTEPAWFAHPDALRRAGADLVMTVRNRGSETALAIGTRAWAAPDNAAAAVSPLAWTRLPPPSQVLDSVSADGLLDFRFQAENGAQQPLTGRWLVLVEADCRDDRSNLHPAAGLACSAALPPSDRSLLADLVAGDNNLGLRCINFD